MTETGRCIGEVLLVVIGLQLTLTVLKCSKPQIREKCVVMAQSWWNLDYIWMAIRDEFTVILSYPWSVAGRNTSSIVVDIATASWLIAAVSLQNHIKSWIIARKCCWSITTWTWNHAVSTQIFFLPWDNRKDCMRLIYESFSDTSPQALLWLSARWASQLLWQPPEVYFLRNCC